MTTKNTERNSSDESVSWQIDSKTLREQVYRAIARSKDGLTDKQIQDITGMNPSTERSLRLELYKDERITHDGKRRTESGHAATVWILNQPLFMCRRNGNTRLHQVASAVDYMEAGQRKEDSDAAEWTCCEVE